MALTPRQQRFVEEYLVDGVGFLAQGTDLSAKESASICFRVSKLPIGAT